MSKKPSAENHSALSSEQIAINELYRAATAIERVDDSYIPRLTFLTPEIAQVLVQWKSDELDFSSLTTLIPEAAQVLSQMWLGRSLVFNSLTTLTPEAAQALSQWPGVSLHLGGLTTLTPEVAQTLSQWKGEALGLDSLSTLTPEVAQTLSQWQGKRLYFGITTITPEIARSLSQWRGDQLHLMKLTTLTPEVAQTLSQWQGEYLNFNGLTTLTPAAAQALSQWQGELELTGLETLSPVAARYLVPFYRNSKLDIGEVDRDDKIKSAQPWNCIVDIMNEDEMHAQIDRTSIEHWQPLFDSHPNFKDLVHQEAQVQHQYLREQGLSRPERFHNLNAGRGAEAVIREALSFFETDCNGAGMPAFLARFESKTKRSFEPSSEFFEVYLDELVQEVADHLQRIIQNARRTLERCSQADTDERRRFLESKINDPDIKAKGKRRFRCDLEKLLSSGGDSAAAEARLAKAETLSEKMSSLHFVRPGQVSYKLASRNTRELTLGDQCSDCTSAKIGGGGVNFWTVPTWLTDPGFNFLLQYDENGDLVHKFGMVWYLKGEEKRMVPALVADSMELGNAQKLKAGMYQEPSDKKREERLTDEAIQFMRQWSIEMGHNPDELYAIAYSNTRTDELMTKYPDKAIQISKLGGLVGPANILKKTNSAYEGQPKVYLQSYQEEMGEQGEIHVSAAIDRGDRNEDFRRVESVLTEFLRSDLSDKPKVQEMMGLARTDAETAARQMRIFLITQAKEETRRALELDGKRLDVFLNSRGHNLEAYLKTILGQTDVTKGRFVRAKLYHLAQGVE
ncbi:hypothetical protein JXD20_03680 [Candidatus Peregrinibacteria bacterium]|nr:hypothetical protein [Candidatus Peregrinibacteria bacterium]